MPRAPREPTSFEKAAFACRQGLHGRRAVEPNRALMQAGRLYHNKLYRLFYVALCLGLMALLIWEPPLQEAPPLNSAGGIAVASVNFVVLSFLVADIALQYRALGCTTWAKRGWTKVKIIAVFLLYLSLLLMVINPSLRWPLYARVLRPLFLVERLRNVRRIASNVWAVIPRLLNVLLLMAFSILFFAVLGHVLFSGQTGDSCEVKREPNPPTCSTFSNVCFDYFASLENAAWQLVQLITATNFPTVAIPAYRCNKWSLVYFIALIVVGIWSLLSLTLAVVFQRFKELLCTEVVETYRRAFANYDIAFSLLLPETSTGTESRSPAPSLTLQQRPLRNPLRRLDSSAEGGSGVELSAVAEWPAARSPVGSGSATHDHQEASPFLSRNTFIIFYHHLRPDVTAECAGLLFDVVDVEGSGSIDRLQFRRLLLHFSRLRFFRVAGSTTSSSSSSSSSSSASVSIKAVKPAYTQAQVQAQAKSPSPGPPPLVADVVLGDTAAGAAISESEDDATGLADVDEDEVEEAAMTAAQAAAAVLNASDPQERMRAMTMAAEVGGDSDLLVFEAPPSALSAAPFPGSACTDGGQDLEEAKVVTRNPLNALSSRKAPSLAATSPSSKATTASSDPGAAAALATTATAATTTLRTTVRHRWLQTLRRAMSTRTSASSPSDGSSGSVAKQQKAGTPLWRIRGRALLTCVPATLFFDFCILLNAIAVLVQLSVEVDAYGQDDASILATIDGLRKTQNALLAVFVFEILSKIVVFGPRGYWRQGFFFRVDLLLVAAAVAGSLVDAIDGAGLSIAVARTLSFLRFARLLRLLRMLPGFGLTVTALSEILGVTSQYMAVLAASLYVFSVVGATAFAGVLSPDNPAVVASSFGQAGFWPLDFSSFPSLAFISAYLLVTNDWPAMMDGLEAGTGSKGVRAYFILFWLCNTLVILNLLVSFSLESFALSTERSKKQAEVRLSLAASSAAAAKAAATAKGGGAGDEGDERDRRGSAMSTASGINAAAALASPDSHLEAWAAMIAAASASGRVSFAGWRIVGKLTKDAMLEELYAKDLRLAFPDSF